MHETAKARPRLSEMRAAGIPRRSAAARAAVIALVAGLGLAGCIQETLHRGYVLNPEALQQIPVGSSREQVLLALGSPSTTGTLGGEVFYYISEKDVRSVAFMNPTVEDRRILAIYFDQEGRIQEIAEYGLKDGKVFDFIAKKTPTGGSDFGFIGQVLRGATQFGPSL